MTLYSRLTQTLSDTSGTPFTTRKYNTNRKYNTTLKYTAPKLLACAIATSLLVACGGSDVESSAPEVPVASTDSDAPSAVFNLATRSFPLAIDLYGFDDDGTISLDDNSNPVTIGLNQIDGFSTTSAIDIYFEAELNPDTVAAFGNVLLINAATGIPAPIQAQALTLGSGEPIIRINPTMPLDSSTQYLVVLGDSIQTSSGESIDMPEDFKFAASSDLSSSDPTDSTIQALSAIQAWIAAGENTLSSANSPDGLALAYTFTTASNTTLTSVASSSEHVAPRTINWIDLDGGANNTIGGAPFFADAAGDTVTMVYQGQIALPQYMGELNTNPALDPFWTNANGNISGTNPLPEMVATEYAPIMITLPGDYSAGGGNDCTLLPSYPVAVFVHGITSNRSASLNWAQALASNACTATVVIDHPLHGMAPLSTDRNGNPVISTLTSILSVNAAEFATNGTSSPWAATVGALLQGGDTTFANLAERHDNVTRDATGARVSMTFGDTVETSAGQSGDNFINLINFARARDNLRQAALDQFNVLASLQTISINGKGLNTDSVSIIGHSLGGIVATSVTAAVNSDTAQAANDQLPQIQNLIVGNPGGQITKLLENSPAFGPTVVGGLAAAGVTQGTSSYESFLQVLQAMLDTADAIASPGLNGTPTLMYEMVGGAAIASGASLSDGLQALFSGIYPPDHTVPNFSYFGVEDSMNPYGGGIADAIGLTSGLTTAFSPLAGSTPLSEVLGLEVVNQSNTTPTSTALVVKMQSGTHSTFAANDDMAAFAEIIGQSLTFMNGAFTVTNTSVLAE
ncbi:Ig-like domain-containing protein [Marinibactrum halimedae]|uniref:Lipase n=1 Tax=Marinibactrum halimedae TaxID=1444977 RepID=A0AA37WL13_9GAMM|nr:Ig-like domain-containing protein [Marinibactrum halimedae]MCD9457472.1 hypothetical protein [Marinibactrum halimedae]GLS25474.1 lipase [Marinibactrum halimedae]